MKVLKSLGLAAVLGALVAPAAFAQATNPDMYEYDLHFGAIAVAAGQPLIYGSATNYTTSREAGGAARRACQRKGGQGCQVAIGFEKGCGALVSDANGKWYAEKADYRSDARDAALAKCKDGCKVEVVACAEDPG